MIKFLYARNEHKHQRQKNEYNCVYKYIIRINFFRSNADMASRENYGNSVSAVSLIALSILSSIYKKKSDIFYMLMILFEVYETFPFSFQNEHVQ